MPIDKNAAVRRLIIDRMIGNKFKKYPTKSDFRRECEESLFGSSNGKHISLSTIEKDLKFMKDNYDAPIRCDKLNNNGYEYTEEGYSIGITDNEYESILLASRILDQFKDTQIFEDFDSVVNKLLERVSLSHRKKNEDKRDYVQFETAPRVMGTEHLSALLYAIKNKQTVNFNYKKFNSNITKRYTLNPYLLKEYRNRWYVIGFSAEKDLIVTFGLDRMSDLAVTKETFEIISGFNLYKFYRHNVGITTVIEEPQRVVLAVTPEEADYLRSMPIHISQKEIKSSKKKVIFELNVIITIELQMILLGLGKNVKVLEPKSLVEQMKRVLKEALGNYR